MYARTLATRTYQTAESTVPAVELALSKILRKIYYMKLRNQMLRVKNSLRDVVALAKISLNSVDGTKNAPTK